MKNSIYLNYKTLRTMDKAEICEIITTEVERLRKEQELLLANFAERLKSRLGSEGLKDKKKKQKKEKRKDGPKPPLTTYIMFTKDNRAAYVEKYPELKATEITKMISEAWKNVDDTVKVHYQKIYEEKRREYEEEKKNYDNNKLNQEEEKQEQTVPEEEKQEEHEQVVPEVSKKKRGRKPSKKE